MKKTYLLSVLCLIVDQIIKYIVTKTLYIGKSITIIPSLFRITYVQNLGAAWSLFAGDRLFLLLVTILAIVTIYVVFLKNKIISKTEQITYGLLLGGILGNFVDRLFRGYVIDYLDVNIGKYNYPIFNVADIFIVLSVLFMIITILREEKNGNNKNRRR